MVVPEAANSASVPVVGALAVAPRRIETVVPTASAICEARVRCQMSRYSDISWPLSSAESWSGLRSGVVGRMASWASWAFLTLVVNRRADGDRKFSPYDRFTWSRTAVRASSARATESVRI